MEDGTAKSLRNICDTEKAADVRSILDLAGDKWSLLVVVLLEHHTRRFMELRRDIGSISQRMLTRTLRQLERDGLVLRTVYPTIPPRVEYALTPLGETLLEAIRPLVNWAMDNREEVAAARAGFDRAAMEEVVGLTRVS
jgi:DNA-binding HxlR family transcriptional regulator